MKNLIRSFCLLIMACGTNANAQIFADVNTSMGNFTIELEYTKTPQTVANFIRLAEGSAPWVDYSSGCVRQDPYYNGVRFHRVIDGFMSQTGSRKGDGTDGPGYQFKDEFDSSLSHTGPYIVSMANSGPNTNGSQIFITAASQSGLNNVHSVFGKVILYDDPGDETSDSSVGRQVCSAINGVATDSSDKPLTDVIINSITIRRVGTTAQNFDVNAQGLPEVSSLPLTFDHQGATVLLNVDQPASSLTYFTSSEDLGNWQSSAEVYLDQDDTAESSMDISSSALGKDRLFYHASQVKYQTGEVLWPRTLTGKDLTVATSYGQTKFTFTSEDGGTLVHDGSISGDFSVVHFSQDGYGTKKYFYTNLSTGSQYLQLRLRIGYDNVFPAYFSGRHSGQTILYNFTTGATTENNTSGAMTLTR